MKNGAVGGKLVGAGGGGFLMFYAADRNRLRHAMAKAGLEEVRFRFDFEGTEGGAFVSLPVAILAGGLATRLRPVTEDTPKALLDVAGKPFVVRQLEYLRQQGIVRVVLCVGYLGEQIRAVVGDGSALGLEVLYSWDGPQLLGTGGALRHALSALGEQFMVLYGDSYLPIDFRRWSGATWKAASRR